VRDGLTGDLIPANDGKALTKAIEPYLAQPVRCEERGRAGLEIAQKYHDIQIEVEGIQKVYNRLLLHE
jgi:mannosyltransferase